MRTKSLLHKVGLILLLHIYVALFSGAIYITATRLFIPLATTANLPTSNLTGGRVYWVDQDSTLYVYSDSLGTWAKIEAAAGTVADVYVRNDGNDTMTGVLTTDGLTVGENENITMGSETIDHDGTDFVASDNFKAPSWESSAADGAHYMSASNTGVASGVDSTVEGRLAFNQADDCVDVAFNSTWLPLSTVRKSECIVVAEPDQIAAITDSLFLINFPAEAYPNGITVTDIIIETASACTDGVILEEKSNSGTAYTDVANIESITLSGTRTEDDGSLADGNIAADNSIWVDFDAATDDIDWISFTFVFRHQSR